MRKSVVRIQTPWSTVACGMVAFAIAVMGQSAVAATFTVNVADDSTDGVCDASHCSLREAIAASNVAAGADLVQFSIPGTGPHQINVLTELPVITQALTIDGLTQPGAVANTRTAEQGDNNAVLKIIVANNGTVNFGLQAAAAPFTLRGISIGGFTQAMLLVPQGAPDLAATANRLEGNYFGLLPDGTTPIMPMSQIGIQNARPLHVGGVLPAQRNVIAGYTLYGIRSQNRYIVLEGNLIGLDASGSSNLAVGSGAPGIHLITGLPVDIPTMRVGGSGLGQGNRLAGRNNPAVSVVCGPPTACYDGLLVQGNTFNLDIAGNSLPLTAFGYGVQIFTSSSGRIKIGGTLAGEGNLFGTSATYIASVLPFPSIATFGHVTFQGNRFLQMSRSASLLPIRLTASNASDTMPLANDTDDADVGPSGMQNKPVVTSLSWDNNTVTVQYRVDSAPANATYPLTIEFIQRGGPQFDSQTGNRYFDTYALADAQQVRTVVLPIGAGSLLPMQLIATSADGGSSEITPEIFGIAIKSDGFE